ncbi:YchF/TatD family DNA exonuclease [Candidatus Curculioniphilus buchneri]|uniref:YchF/TatD family DNA exonuclease n=1 Tax=Candidatus Curculioniphilus buchneri TaxID=690594 RepID=UPI00376EFDE9
MFLVDSHCHLDILNYETLHRNVDDVVAQAYSCDVKLILTNCITLSNFNTIIKIIDRRNDVLLSCGIHPLKLDQPYNFTELRRLITSHDKVIAIGETGLDYYHQEDNKRQQQTVFREHIRLGREQNKPVIIHTRAACKDTLSILHEEKASECGGVLHCFTENLDTAKILLNMGFYISFSGIITFRNAASLRIIARYVPLDLLLIETDSPYLAPVPYRGKENQPAYLRNIAECISILKGITLEQLADATTNNFGRLFHVDIASMTH